MHRRVGDRKHLSSKFILLDLLHKLSRFSQETLDPPVLTVGHTELPFVWQKRQTMRDFKRDPFALV